jgi:hypothetical protein
MVFNGSKQTELIPSSKAVLQKLIFAQPFKIPVFYGTGRFITVITRALHCPEPVGSSPHTPTLYP